MSQPRRSRGMPAGGQFAPMTHPEPDLVIGPSWPGLTFTVESQFGGVTLHAWQNDAGNYQDPPDGSPAVSEYRADGSLASEEHYRDGCLDDPEDGGPAIRSFYPDGSESWCEHYRDGVLTDAPDGSPAIALRSRSGEARLAAHFVNGRRVP